MAEYGIRIEVELAKAPDINAYFAEVEKTMTREGDEIKKHWKQFFESWVVEPDIPVRRSFNRRTGWFEVFVGPKADAGLMQIIGWVIRGTKKNYPIRPKHEQLLRYQSLFTAKTMPGVVQSGAGGKYGPWTTRESVIHPGIEARETDVAIKNVREPEFLKLTAGAFARGMGSAVRRARIV